MSIRGLLRKSGPVGNATPSNAPIYVDSDDNKLKMIPAGSGSTEVEVIDASSTQTLTGKTVSGPEPAEVATAADDITAAESGKTFFLNSATEFALTLPAPAIGLFYRFIVKAAPSGASYTVVTNASAQNLAGQVFSSAGADEDSETAQTATTITFVDGTAVIGDMAEVWSDGDGWYARCFCNATGGITITG